MNDIWATIFQYAMGTGGLGGIIAVVVSILKAKNDKEDLETTIQNKVLTMASTMLDSTEKRLAASETRATATLEDAEKRIRELEERARVSSQLAEKVVKDFEEYKREAEYVLQRIYAAVESGSFSMIPPRPPWLTIPDWVRNERKKEEGKK